jgi:uncharacterized protein YneF (UPF0154 family)
VGDMWGMFLPRKTLGNRVKNDPFFSWAFCRGVCVGDVWGMFLPRKTLGNRVKNDLFFFQYRGFVG